MLPFLVNFRPGVPPYEDIVLGVKKAIATGRLNAGDRFPSVRTVSRELNLNPNTCQRAVAELTEMGILEVKVGVGTFVSDRAEIPSEAAAKLLHETIELLIIEARQLGVSDNELKKYIDTAWKELK